MAVHDPELLPRLVRRLDDADIVVAELALEQASLDDVFLRLTGQETSAEAPAGRTLE